jgi:beta-lactamase superfamily II metal-dependent hydrolase
MGESEMTTSKKAALSGGKKNPSKTKKGHSAAVKKTGSKKHTSTKKTPTLNAAGASGLKVRMYRVGFGDFFLVIVPAADGGERYILIDCGVFKGTSGTGDIGSIEDAVEDLFQTTGGKLALVIMTHRHADHIAGFNRATEIFQKFEASMVWMPYWEQFNDAKDSAMNLQADIEQLALRLGMQFRGRADENTNVALDLLSNATGIDFSAAATSTKKLSGNAAALDLLKNHLGKSGKNVRYYAAGDVAELPPELEGLSAKILGPPPKDAQVFMKLEDLKKGVGQYLDSSAISDEGSVRLQPFRQQWRADPSQDYPTMDTRGKPIKYEEVAADVASAQPDLLATAAKKIDNFLNNQSLVVLFQFGDKNLLFVGDAQAGNWEHWLYRIDAPIKDPTQAGPITDESQQILQRIDFYKMGHHGSTNATPIQVVEIIGKARTDEGFVAMCSTEPGVYGNPDPKKGTEVPRGPLMDALGAECSLIRSDAFAIKTKSAGEIPATVGLAAPPQPKVGTLVKGDLYVEYSF